MPKLMSRLGRWLTAGREPAAGRKGPRTVTPPANVHPVSEATLSASCLMKRVHAVVEMTGHGPVMSALPQETRPLFDVLWGGLREFALPGPGAPAAVPPAVPVWASSDPVNPLPALRKVVVVVLTWNGLELTRRCLDTLRRNTTHPDYEVWVVDNASHDGTVEYLRTLSWVRLIENDRNLGFVRGNNQAIAACDGAADIVLLNNDMEVHQPDWLERLQHSAWSAPDVGIVGCRLRRPDGRLQHAGAYMPLDSFWGQQIAAHEEDVGQYTRDREVEGVVFACAYLKRELIRAIGPLDERFFAYFEDTDYCLSARAAGFRTLCCGAVTLDHNENSSTRVNGVAHRPLFLSSQAAFREKWEGRLRATRYTHRLGWHSTISLPTGYSISSRELVLALDRAGVEVGYRYLYGPGSTQPATEPAQTGHDLLNHVRARPLDPNGVHVAYGQADAFHRAKGRYRIGYTMLETDGVPRAWVEQANRMDEIWVPSTFNVQTMRDSGVVRPIHCVPLGIDPHYFHPRIEGSRHGRAFTFLSVFEWGERKAPEVLLRAFTDEFRAHDDVVLLLKVVNRDGDVDVREQIAHLGLDRGGGRVLLSLNDVIPTYQLGSLYRSADCLVLASRGEGWGMPALEAMACGLPVIATKWSAMTDFLDESVAYPLDVERLVPAVAKCPYYEGFSWAEPSYEHLRHQMRHIFEHQEEARTRGIRASEVAHAKWTWDRAAQRIVQRLTEIGGGT